MDTDQKYNTPIAINGKKQVIISPAIITIFLFVMAGLLLFANTLAIFLSTILESKSMFSFYLTKYFHFNGENNFPSLFSTLLLLLGSGFLALIFLGEKGAAKGRKHWLLLSMIFIFLAIDENIQVHEKVSDFVRPLLPSDGNGFFHWAWVIPYFIFFVVVSVYFLPFVKNLNPKLRKLFFVSGSLFVGGALGLELFEGYFFKLYGIDHLYNQLLYSAEEFLEMSGVILLLYALMDYMAGYEASIVILKKESIDREYELKGYIRSEGPSQANKIKE